MAVFNVLPRVPLEALSKVYLTTPSGLTLGLAPGPWAGDGNDRFFLYQELGPVYPRVASRLGPKAFCELVTAPDKLVTLPRLAFIDLKLGRLASDTDIQLDGTITELGAPQPFEVVRLREGTLPGATPDAVGEFNARLAEANRIFSAADQAMHQAEERIALVAKALATSTADAALTAELQAIRQELGDLAVELDGNPTLGTLSVPTPPTIGSRLQVAGIGVLFSTYGPTPTHRRSLEIAEQELAAFRPRLAKLVAETLPAFEAKLDAAGVPWTPGRPVP